MTAIATTLRRGQVSRRRLHDYHDVAPEALLDEVVSLGRSLDGARVLHASAASIDRGVAELIATEVALLNDLGIHAESRVIPHDDAFRATAERMRDALEGQALPPERRTSAPTWPATSSSRGGSAINGT